MGNYQLRCPQGKLPPLQGALLSEITALSLMDQELVHCAKILLDERVPLVDRLPVTELLVPYQSI